MDFKLRIILYTYVIYFVCVLIRIVHRIDMDFMSIDAIIIIIIITVV